MNRPTKIVISGLMALGAVTLAGTPVSAQQAVDVPGLKPNNTATTSAPIPVADTSNPRPLAPITGQGKMRFKVFLTSERFPDEVKKALRSAHGGSAVDHRPGKGETYFFLRGAGILQVSSNMQSIRLLPTAEPMKNVNLHNTSIWYGPDGAAHLAFPANDAGQIFTTDLEGKLLHTLGAPTAGQDLGNVACNEYFANNGKFAPTGVDYLNGLYYVSTGYSNLDYVLTAQIGSNPLKATWHDLSFGGRGNGAGQFGTGHSITVPLGQKRVDVADRANAEIDRFTRYGHYLGTLKLPPGTLSCDVDYLDNYAVVPALDGPDRTKGAPIYLLENDQVVSTIMPKEELGLTTFQHIHNAVLRKVGGKLYIIMQSWNPGDFAILEQVTE